jgi:adenosine deaminase
VRRVQHGIRAVEDPGVVALLRDRDVTCDVCVTSNVKLGVVAGYEHHPLPALLDAGVRCTISTDDPFCFGGTLTDEYLVLATRMGFTRERLAQVAKNGLDMDPGRRTQGTE